MSTNQPEPNPQDGSQPGHTPPPAGHTPPPAPGFPPPAAGQAPPPQYGAPVAGAPVAGAPLTQSEERTWAMLGHLGGIFLYFVAPLITWLVFRERSAFVNDQGKEALNFQITVAIGFAVSGLLTVILVGFVGLIVLPIANLVLCIIAGLAANNGTAYRYPLTLRLIK